MFNFLKRLFDKIVNFIKSIFKRQSKIKEQQDEADLDASNDNCQKNPDQQSQSISNPLEDEHKEDQSNIGDQRVLVVAMVKEADDKVVIDITSSNITLTSSSANKIYDGDPLINHRVTRSNNGKIWIGYIDQTPRNGVDVSKYTKLDNAVIRFNHIVSGSQTDVGTSCNTFDSIMHVFVDGKEVTDFVNTIQMVYNYGTLTVTKRKIEM